MNHTPKIVLLVLFGIASAAFRPSDAQAEVVSGTVVSISPVTGRLVVKERNGGANRSIEISKSARVSLDGQSVSVNKIKPGFQISAFVSGRSASRLIVRNATEEPLPKKTSSAKPETTKTVPVKPTPADEPKPPARSGSRVASSRPSSRPPGRSTPSSPVDSNNVGTVEWNQFRGPNRDNISRETGLLKNWSDDGPERLWTANGIGEAYSSVVISDGRVVTMGTIGSDEYVIALDLADGSEIWKSRSGPRVTDGTGNGPRGTPSVVDGRVYALGAAGDLVCLDADSGQNVWRKNILQEFGGENIQWKISESVLVDGDRVICTPGGSRATMVALNRDDGSAVWTSRVPGNPKAAYSSPIAVEVGGVKQYVTYTHEGVVGVRARDGAQMWGQRESANGTANCSTPISVGNFIFTASGYDTGGAFFRLQSGGGQTRSEVVYKSREMVNHHGGMVALDGYLYGTNERTLLCLELRTGRVVWQERSVGKGSITLADGHLYVRSEQGPVALVEATPDGYREKGRFDQPDRSGRSAWSHPVVADGKLFLRDMDRLLVYDVRDR